MAVCSWRFAPIRWVLFSGMFLFIGGGDAVTSSMLHVMVTDATYRAERAQIFLHVHAADVLSGFFGPAISAWLMEKGHPWTVLVLAEVVLFGTFILAQFIPETQHLTNGTYDNPSDVDSTCQQPKTSSSQRSTTSSESTSETISLLLKISSILAPLVSLLRTNRQCLLLLAIFAPQASARELFTVTGLQYSKAKYSLSCARGNVLLSLFQGAQGLFVLVLLPLINRTIAKPRGWTDWTRDRLYAIASIAAAALGPMVIGPAPVLAVVVIGLLGGARHLHNGVVNEFVGRSRAPEPGEHGL
ncbi:hypothetical protein J3459_016931 [Metarhizium acridum]|uniref:uncharacterized protein n=1 Tax=Metarhizium acridum TaxID=92637 RepID=UPI001C6B0CB4|nr:hypothetical protein J3458_021398 [Metarhizium acridum]KAG8410843.1 hypothetical protein J3459_016931 [Metarhizium acridum]